MKEAHGPGQDSSALPAGNVPFTGHGEADEGHSHAEKNGIAGPASRSRRIMAGICLAAAALSGFTAMTYEIAWTRLFAPENREYWKDRRVHVTIGDAKHFVKTASKGYDVIIQ